LLRLGQAHARHQQTINRGLLELIGVLEGRLDGIRQAIEEISARNDTLAGTTTGLVQRIGTLEGRAGALEGRAGALEDRLPWLEILGREIRAVPDLDAIGLERFDAAAVGTVIGYRNGTPLSPEDDYVGFEDVFRLSEAVIRKRQRTYLPLLDGRQPVLDAGCGRGEFLELLREAGVPARGVDLDPGMVARAQSKGLDVERGDLIACLDNMPDGSLGVVFAAQVVEHLSYADLLAFLRIAHMKLQPDGLLIAETVNPHAPGALKGFWTDLTHQHPIFPEVLLTLCRGAGFTSGYVFYPGGTGDLDTDRQRHGDYAVVAERAARDREPPSNG
jgi:SAM-dependent methyltransferase